MSNGRIVACPTCGVPWDEHELNSLRGVDQLERARAEALEVAAKVADSRWGDRTRTVRERLQAQDIAEAIRALKESKP